MHNTFQERPLSELRTPTMKTALQAEAEEVSINGPNAFYVYCALTLFDNAALGSQIREALWDHFDQSVDMDHWKQTIDSSHFRRVMTGGGGDANYPPLDVLATLATRVYPLNVRIYSKSYAEGHRDYTACLEGGARRGMTLRTGDAGELYLVVKHNSKTGKNRVPATVINVLSTASPPPVHSKSLADNLTSPFSLAVYDSETRTYMPIGARFIPPRPASNGGKGGGDKAHYMNFDLGLSRIKPSWQFILKGCKDIPVFVFAMRTKDGVRHASYIAHWPVDMVEPQITISQKHGDDGLIVVPLESNSLEEAKKHVVAELKCIVDA